MAAGLLAFANSFPGTLVLDDFSSVLENPSIRALWPPAWLSPPAEAGVAGRPFANLTYALNFALSADRPWSYHAGNFLLHLLSALTLFGLVRRTFASPALASSWSERATSIAALAAILWTTHPLTTAVVNYVSQRTEALMALAYLATLYAFARGAASGRRRWFVGAVLASALGMLSKEVMVTAPVVVLLYDRTFFAGSFAAACRLRGGWHLGLAATWALLALALATSPVADRGVGFGLGVGTREYMLTQSFAVAHYLQLAIWPRPLVFDYGWTFVTDPRAVLVPLFVCALLIGGTFVALRKRPVLGFAGAWFLIILAPTSSVVPIIQQPIAESRAYLPLAGVIVLAVAGLGWFTRRQPRWLPLAGGILALLLGAGTWVRNQAYASELTLWADTIAKRPDNARAHGNFAAAALRAGQVPEAIAAAREALRLQGNYPDAHVNLGQALQSQGETREALLHYRAALAAMPAHPVANYNLGVALAQAGDRAAAVAHFETALRHRPVFAAAHNNLGVVLLQLGRIDDAIAHSRAALAIAPGFADAHYNLGNALATAGRAEEAIAAYAAALRADPKLAKAANNTGVVLLRTGRVSEAATHFEAALRIDSGYAEARRNLERIRAGIGR